MDRPLMQRHENDDVRHNVPCWSGHGIVPVRIEVPRRELGQKKGAFVGSFRAVIAAAWTQGKVSRVRRRPFNLELFLRKSAP